MRAIEDSIREALKEAGATLMRTDGQRGHLWRALDYGSVIIHVMDQKTRDFYAMERLWERSKSIEWKPAPKAPAKPPVKLMKKPVKKAKAPAKKKKAAPRKKKK